MKLVVCIGLFLAVSYFFFKRAKYIKFCWLRFIASIIVGIIITFLMPEKIFGQYNYCDSEKIKVTTTGDKNQDALTNEIIINYIKVDNSYYDAPDCVISGNWYSDENMLNWKNYIVNNEISNYIELEIPAGYNRKISFSSNVYRGIAEIEFRENIINIDFFSNTTDLAQEKILNLDNGKKYSDTILLVFKFIAIIIIGLNIYYISSIISKFLKQSRYKEIDLWICVFFFFFTIFAACTHTNSPLSEMVPWVDSDVFLYGGWAMNHGEKMYIDFWDHKGPYLYFIEWFGYMLTGSWTGVWYIEVLGIYISLLAIFFLLRRYSESLIPVISICLGYTYLILYLGNGNYIETYTLPLISISALIFDNYFYENKRKLSSGNCIILGMLFLCAAFMRPNSIAIWIVFCIGIVIDIIIKKDYIDIVRYGIKFLIGMVLAFIPIFIYMTWSRGWGEFYKAYIEFNFKYVSASDSKIKAIEYFMFTSINLFCLTGILWSLLKQKISIKLVSITSWYLLSMYFVCMSGSTWNHYATIMLPVYCTGIFLLFTNLKLKLQLFDKKKYGVWIGIVVFIITIAVTTDNKRNIISYNNSKQIIKYSYHNNKEVKVISRLIKEKLSDEETISVYGNSCKYYLLSEKKSASRYTYQNPLCSVDPEIGKEYIAEIRQKMPGAIVIGDNDIFNKDDMYETNEQLLKLLNENYHIEYVTDNVSLYLLKNNSQLKESK